MRDEIRLLNQVLERDVDLALLSVIFASDLFRNFILEKVFSEMNHHKSSHKLIRTCVSEITDAGETDLLFVVDLNGLGRTAIMIEDKIDAIFQRAQAARYRQRGENGIHDGSWTFFKTCLFAPQNYLDNVWQKDDWDAYISLEEIASWLGLSENRHFEFVSAICKQAVTKHDREKQDASKEAMAFWQSYLALASDLLPSTTLAFFRWWFLSIACHSAGIAEAEAVRRD
jgi:hypothetical protein